MVASCDNAVAVRAGEELDLARLSAYLSRHFDGPGPVAVEQFPAGHSNLTYRVTWGGRELVLRRPPFGSQVKSAHDMGREYRVLSRLHETYPVAPKVILYCDDLSVLDAPFYLMEPIRGIILRRQLPPGLLAVSQLGHGSSARLSSTTSCACTPSSTTKSALVIWVSRKVISNAR